MVTVLQNLQKKSRRRLRRAERSHQRLDIQGLRMVAVTTVFASHLWDWPPGGFIGVDVFFVISGFLITGNLLRAAEKSGNISFRNFYWNRIRRIVPAATGVLALTYLAATLVFLPFRAEAIGIDALFAFLFMSNWWFAHKETNYFAADDAVSPVLHYWSLSIEEQFYFVWPALIFLIGLLVARKAWSHQHRMRTAGIAMLCIVCASLTWAVYETAHAPAFAYFNTFARIWELGVGALLATSVGALARIPTDVKPILSWCGLSAIAASIFLINEGSLGFPAPWAILPVAGSALVIAAGVGKEPRAQAFLRNPVSVYIGNISYSLYLVHWPVIVILGSIMPRGGYFSAAAVAISLGLSILSFHLVENPLRYGSWKKRSRTSKPKRSTQRRRSELHQSTTTAATVVGLLLLTAGLAAYSVRPIVASQTLPPLVASTDGDPADEAVANIGPITSALQKEIAEALAATSWPPLDPTMEEAMSTPESPPEVHACNGADPSVQDECAWGSASASTEALIVGDSVALAYAGPLRQLALNSEGKLRLRVAAMGGCEFVDVPIYNPDESVVAKCPNYVERVVDYINAAKPDVVIISNIYGPRKVVGTNSNITYRDWSDALQRLIDKFRTNVGEVVLLSAPPADKNIRECYGKRSGVPADCISEVGGTWRSLAYAEQRVADSVGGTWIDSRPWFCSPEGLCPSFVGSTPTKLDTNHMSLAYGEKLHPAIGESFATAGVF